MRTKVTISYKIEQAGKEVNSEYPNYFSRDYCIESDSKNKELNFEAFNIFHASIQSDFFNHLKNTGFKIWKNNPYTEVGLKKGFDDKNQDKPE